MYIGGARGSSFSYSRAIIGVIITVVIGVAVTILGVMLGPEGRHFTGHARDLRP